MKFPDQLPSLFSAQFYRDPYPLYAALRKRDPVHWDQERQVWVLTRYADVAASLADYAPLVKEVEDMRATRKAKAQL